MIPTGFTPITTDYNPIVPAPPISSLEQGTAETLSGNALIPGELVTIENGSIVPYAPSSELYSLQLSVDKAYIRPGDSFKFTCVFNGDRQGLLGKSVVIRALAYEENKVVDLQPKAFEGKFNSFGTAEVVGKLGFLTQSGAKLQFLAHIPASRVVPDLLILTEELLKLDIYSNLSSITSVASSSNSEVVYKDPPTPQGVPLIPIHDVVISTSTYIFRTFVLDQEIDLSPTNDNPRGSSGNGIYSDLNIPSPISSGVHNRSPIEAVQNLMGSAIDELERVKGWAEEILDKVHSVSEGISNSESAIIRNLIPDITPSIERYQAAIEEAGRYAADTADTYATDYANGNTISTSNAVEQHNVGQLRVQTASAYTVNSPTVSLSSQQSITQSRFEHHAGDLFQASHIYYWIRAEDQYTCIAENSARYNQSELAEFSANATYAAGNRTDYSDTQWSQVGQGRPPLHTTNSRSATNYGNSIELIQKDKKLKTLTGSVIINSGVSVYAQAATDMTLRGNSFSAQALSGSANIQSNQSANVRGEARASLSSAGITSIDGSIVFINGGKSRIQAPAAPRIITELPKIFDSMVDVVQYPRSAPVSPGPRGSRGSKTPEPGNTPTDTGAGGWLTKHATSIPGVTPGFNGGLE